MIRKNLTISFNQNQLIMKKVISTLLLVLPLFVYGQTIVDTEPQNKNVILEQYTGINCVFCPQGSTIANQIYNANPDRVVVIAVHAGGFANPQAGQPDFRTPFGPSLLAQTGITGFPGGTVNRHVFPGLEMTPGGTGMGRGNWTNASNQILAQPSYLNVGAEAQIDLETRELTVNVEVYYTGNSPFSTNKLNVALLQDKTYAFQSGGGPDYEHNNRLVHLISGQWGVDITTTTEGSLHSETFNYTIPDHYNQVPAELENMRVAVFVAENTQVIISGVQVSPFFINAPEFEYAISGHSIPSELWDGILEPVFEIKSYCQELTSLDIEYYVNDGSVHTYEWTGSLNFGQTEEVTLPEIQFDILEQNELVINILNEDDSPEDNSITVNFALAPGTSNNDLVVQVRTDQYGSETTWNITTQEGAVVANGGPYPNATNTHNHDVSLPMGNYKLTINDSFGDGILGGGYIRIIDDGEILLNIPGNSFTFIASRKFRVMEEDLLINFDVDDLSEGIDLDGEVNVTFSLPVTFTDGTEITNANVHELITYTQIDKSGTPVAFTATISEDKKTISIIPDVILDFNTQYFIEISPVLGANGVISEPISITFTTRESLGAPVATFDIMDHESDVPVNHTFTIEFNQSVRHADGSNITILNIGQLLTFRKDDMHGDAVNYTATINSEKTQITVSPLANLANNQLYVLGIDALMGVDDEISEPVYVSFTTEEALFVNEFDPASINIFPNPTKGDIFIELPPVHSDVNIRLFHINGQLAYETLTQGSTVKIDASQFSAGIYFVEIIADGKIARKKITVVQ